MTTEVTPLCAPNIEYVSKEENYTFKTYQKTKLQEKECQYKQRQIDEQQIRFQQMLEEKRQAEIRRKTIENNRKNNINLNEYNVFEKSNITLDELNNIFNNVKKTKMKMFSKACIDAEEVYGVNAIFLASIISLESGYGSKPAGNNDNYTGYAVYTSSSRGASFDGGYYENIMKTAELLLGYKEKYGLYSIWQINSKYCFNQDQVTVNYNWSSQLINISNNYINTYHNKVKQLEEIN